MKLFCRPMEETKSLAQQQQMILQHQQQQQLVLLQQLQKQQQHQKQGAISRFPSNIDAHLRPLGINRAMGLSQSPNSNPNSVGIITQPQQQMTTIKNSNSQQSQKMGRSLSSLPMPASAPPMGGNQAELQMAYQDAWHICHPDFKRPFSSVEDACERLLPYHVVADYEAEEDDRILDSDTTGQMLSRSQQWDHNIAAKVAEFTGTFEKQALAFNIISRKRAVGEFRSEERLMIEQALLQEEKRAMLELRAEIETREKATREAHEAKLRMVNLQAEQARVESQACAPIRPSAQQANEVAVCDEMSEQNPDELMNGWEGNTLRDDKEPSEDFLNDEEAENGDAEWHDTGEFDLNSSR